MGEIATSERQITLFYSSDSSRAKQALAYAKSEGLPIQKIDILKKYSNFNIILGNSTSFGTYLKNDDSIISSLMNSKLNNYYFYNMSLKSAT